MKQVFKECCAKTLYTVINGKLYTCPFIANANELRAIPDNRADYVELNLNDENLRNKITKLVKENLFSGLIFVTVDKILIMLLNMLEKD